MESQHSPGKQETTVETQGAVWNWAKRYDLLMGFVTLGREQAFRRKIANLAELQPGEEVLDVGCGTGTLAIVAKQLVGETGRVSGIDPSSQMIARANHKTARHGLAIDFQVGVIEQLSFPDQSFDVVLSMFMMHHLPEDLKRRGIAEVARGLKPGGRLLVVDLTSPAGPWKSRMSDLPTLLKDAGFSSLETGEVPFPRTLRCVCTKRGEPAQQPHCGGDQMNPDVPSLVTIQITPESKPTIPSWMGEVAAFAHVLEKLTAAF